MAIHIEEINAKGLGPLDEFTGKLGKFNMIYGRNEQGKTFLVEFLLKSIFDNVTGFSLRDVSPTGTVLVAGLEPEPCQFSPSSRKKLEDYWVDNFQGMPTNVAQLLVVKGAELDFVNTIPSGINKTVVKSFLSSERTLEFVQGKILKTVQNATIENGEIIGAKVGDLKKRKSTLDKLEQIDSILHKVDQDYSGGSLTALLSKKETLQERISNQDNAKRYLAYTRSKEVKKLEKKIHYMEESGFQNLIENHDEILRKSDVLQKMQERMESVAEKSKHYEWISTAIEEYEKFLNQGASPIRRLNLVLALILFSGAALLTIIGFLLHLLDLPIIGEFIFCVIGIAIVLGMILGLLFFRQQQKRQSVLVQSNELERIESSYGDKFGKPLTDIATLKSHQQSMQQDYYETQTLSKDINELKSEIELLKAQIQNGFEKLDVTYEDESTWAEQIKKQEDAYSETEKQIQELHIELANLDVDPEEYLEIDPEIQYDRSELARYNNELKEVQEQIRGEEQILELLKIEIRTAISDRTSTSWDHLLDKLPQHRDQLLGAYKEKTSKILAEIIITQVLQDTRQQEDEKLKVMLRMPIVKKPLFEITKKYKEVTFDGENLRVSDKYEEFDIADLSTAAKEQVLLALRLGFAAKIMGQETAFLILDDAFQHSDWERREYLLDTVISLANNGWQIIYFSMDDHIRDLFNEMGKETFKSDYYYYEL